MNNNNNILKKLSPHLFWDVDIHEIDVDKHAVFLIERVLMYGLLSDFRLILKTYGLNFIVEKMKNSRQIDKKTASFLAALSGISNNEFLCYTTTQSTNELWSS